MTIAPKTMPYLLILAVDHLDLILIINNIPFSRCSTFS
jgi:hypothetical protein